jgi:outer membrane cobalamin receptor
LADSGVIEGAPNGNQSGITEQQDEPVEASKEPAATSSGTGEEAVFQLPQIGVEGEKIVAPPALIIRQVSIADMEASNAHTVGDALTYVPGVNVQIGGSSGDARAWVRGYRDRDVLVLYDGIPVASGFEGTIDLNEIAVQGVTSIDVIKSAPSVIYGTNGVGGVISVVPAWGIMESFLDGRVELGSDDKRFAQASGGRSNGNLSVALSAQYQTADDYSLSNDYVPQLNQPAGRRVNSDFERSSLFFQFEAQETLLGHTSFFYNLSNAEKGLAVEAGVEDPDYERLTDSQRQTLGLSNTFNEIPLSLKLYYNAYDSELTAYTDDDFVEVDDVESTEDYSVGGNLYSTLSTSSNNTLVLTAGVRKEVFKGEGELEDGNKAELTTYTVAVEDEFWITSKLSLAAGGIFVYFDQTELDQSSSEFNPQLALAWQATDRLSFHASAAERTRFPKLRELYRRRYGNPDLDPQTAVNTELGMLFQHNDGWRSDFSVFHSKIDGLIERADRRARYTNFDRVTIDGVEMATSISSGDRFLMRLAYTYIDASEDVPGGGSRQLRSRPKNTAIAELRYLFPGAVSVSFNGIYVSGLYDLDAENIYTRIPSYFVSSIKAAWAFSENYEAYLAISNLGDTDYLHRFGDPREGRRLMLGLNFGFGL